MNATCDVSWKQLRAHLNDPALPAPVPENVIQYELGTLEGVRLTFTDAAFAADWSTSPLPPRRRRTASATGRSRAR